MSKLNANRKGNRLLRLMIFASFFAALIFIATAFLPRIPTALGYVHLGDAFVLIAAALLPAPYAIASAAIGGALADLLTGYVVWLPATFIIKALMALCISSRTKKIVAPRNLCGAAIAILINAGGYYLFQAIFISQSLIAPLPEIPFNIIQTAVGGVIFVIIGLLLDRSPAIKNMVPKVSRNENDHPIHQNEQSENRDN